MPVKTKIIVKPKDYRNSNKGYANGAAGGGLTINKLEGNYLPARKDNNGNYIVNLSQVKFNGDIYAGGEITAFMRGSEQTKPPVTVLNDLKDVELTSTQNGQFLTYDSSIGKWKNATVTIEGGGGDKPAVWENIIGKPSVFPPAEHTHLVTDIPQLSTYYTTVSNFKMHTGSKTLHTNAEEKKKWNDGVDAASNHIADADIHVDLDLKTKITDLLAVMDDQTAIALLRLLENIEVTAGGDIRLKKNLIVGGEITAHYPFTAKEGGNV